MIGLPLIVGAASAWAAVWGTMMLPWIPSRIGFHVLPPIPEAEVKGADDHALYDRVVGALQRKLHEATAASKKSTAEPIPETPGLSGLSRPGEP